MLSVSTLLSLAICTGVAQAAHSHELSARHVRARATTDDALLQALFPVSVKTSGSGGWTTADGAPNSITLNDDNLVIRNVTKDVEHPYVTGPEGRSSIEATYPTGSYNFQHTPRGGFGFYAAGPSRVDVTSAREVTLGYSVYFEDGFNFVKGGKLPGLYGGNSADGSIGCSGGSRSTECFSARLMWRTSGQAELYTYLPDKNQAGFSANQNLCKASSGAVKSLCNSEYGASTDRGAFTFAVGQWNHVAERVRLNDVGKANGEIEIFFNGVSKILVTGLLLQDTSGDSRIRGIDMQTFFGGDDTSYATPTTQHTFFSDFSVAITHAYSESGLAVTEPKATSSGGSSTTATTLKPSTSTGTKKSSTVSTSSTASPSSTGAGSSVTPDKMLFSSLLALVVFFL